MYRLNNFLIQKKYNKTEKELIINDYIEGIKYINYDYYKNVYDMKNNKFNSEYLQWYKNGQLYIKCHHKNGKFNGEWLAWHENGQLRLKCYHKNDKLTGECHVWYVNGQLMEKYCYKNGIKS